MTKQFDTIRNNQGTMLSVLLLLFCLAVQAAETSQSLAAQLRALNTSRADTARSLTVLRAGMMVEDRRTAGVSVTAYLKNGRARYDLIVNEVTDPPAAPDSVELKKPETRDTLSFRDYMKNTGSRDPRSKNPFDSKIMVNDGTGWTAITPRSKNPNAEFGWRDLAVVNWLTPEQLSRGVLQGEERVRGRNCWIIEWNSGQLNRAWVDKATLCIVRATSKAGKRAGEYRLEWSDFRDVEGAWEMPYRSELFLNNESQVTLTTTEIKASHNLWEGLFEAERIDKPAGRASSGGRSPGGR